MSSMWLYVQWSTWYLVRYTQTWLNDSELTITYLRWGTWKSLALSMRFVTLAREEDLISILALARKAEALGPTYPINNTKDIDKALYSTQSKRLNTLFPLPCSSPTNFWLTTFLVWISRILPLLPELGSTHQGCDILPNDDESNKSHYNRQERSNI